MTRNSLASESFDLVAAGTCWHWFDRLAAAKEARRLLSAQGRIAIAAMDIAYRPGGISEAITQLFREFYGLSHEASIKVRHRMTFNWPAWLDDLSAAGFGGFECFGFECEVGYTHDAFRGRIRASAAGGVLVPSERRMEFDRRFEAMIEHFPEEPLMVPHQVFTVIGVVS